MTRLSDLLDQLKSPHVMYRTRAAKELGDLGDPAAGPALIAALADESHLVRDNAAFALGALHCREALDPLAKAAIDSGRWLATAASSTPASLPAARAWIWEM